MNPKYSVHTLQGNTTVNGSELKFQKCGKKGDYAKVCKQRNNNRQAVRELTEEETSEPIESMRKSDEPISQKSNEIREEKEKH